MAGREREREREKESEKENSDGYFSGRKKRREGKMRETEGEQS